MDTVTKTTTKGKSKRERSLKIGPAVNGIFGLSLTTNGETKSYYLKEIPVDFGRGFQLDKFSRNRRATTTAPITSISTRSSATAALARASSTGASASTSMRSRRS